MKKMILITLCLVTHLAYSQLPNITINNFSGNYANSTGEATSEVFKYADIEFEKDSTFTMYKQAGVFFLKTPDEEVQLDDIPDQINDLKDVSFSGVNIETTQSKISVNIPSLSGSSADEKKVDLSNFILNCEGDLSGVDTKEAVLDTCFNKKGSVTLDKFVSNKDKMKNLSVSVLNNRLSFRAKVSGVTARGWGTSEYIASENKVLIKVDKVKVKFLNVTGKFFKELAKQDSENIVVNRPYIEIFLD